MLKHEKNSNFLQATISEVYRIAVAFLPAQHPRSTRSNLSKRASNDYQTSNPANLKKQ